MKQVLSIEQMKHLKELGLDTSDASMCMDADTNYDYYHGTYTLQDILNKLPCFIGNQVFTIHKLVDSYTCLYIELYTRSFINITEGEELIDAAYDMLCWCIENGYVKVGEEEK